jgi:hypothetical protein
MPGQLNSLTLNVIGQCYAHVRPQEVHHLSPPALPNESVCEANQYNELPIIAHFRRKRVIGARSDLVPLRIPTKSAAGKLYRKISILVIPNCQELSIRGPSAAA